LTTAPQRTSSLTRNAPNSFGPKRARNGSQTGELLDDIGRLDDLVDGRAETIDPLFRRPGGDDDAEPCRQVDFRTSLLRAA
jgi:hypothetical protein